MTNEVAGTILLPCPHCAAEGMLRIGQTAIHGELRWYESLNCSACSCASESDGDGFPPGEMRSRILDEHGEWVVILPAVKSNAETARVLRIYLGLDSRDALQRMKTSHSQGVYFGTRVECEWLANKLILSSEHPIVQRPAASESAHQGRLTGSGETDHTPVDERRQKLWSAMDEFVSTPSAPLDLAGRIEVMLDDLYPNDDYLQETVEMLACYRPEEMEWTIGWGPMRSRLIGVRRHLEASCDEAKSEANEGKNHPPSTAG